MTTHDNQSPWTIPVAQVGRRPGLTKQIDNVMPAPSGIGDTYFGVPEGSDIKVCGQIESLAEGLLFTGKAVAQVQGECGRCLKDLNQSWPVDFSAYFPYGNLDDKTDTDLDPEEEEESLDTYPLLEDGTIMDIETLLRDVLVESLPLQPLCKPDCLGLCPVCGFDLNEDPSHAHETIDDRWSGLANLRRQLEKDNDVQ